MLKTTTYTHHSANNSGPKSQVILASLRSKAGLPPLHSETVSGRVSSAVSNSISRPAIKGTPSRPRQNLTTPTVQKALFWLATIFWLAGAAAADQSDSYGSTSSKWAQIATISSSKANLILANYSPDTAPNSTSFQADKKRDIEASVESLSNLLEDFRVPFNKDTWIEKTDRNGLAYYEHPVHHDIWQVGTSGVQFFTYQAAARELARAGRRIPSPAEWEKLVSKAKQELASMNDGKKNKKTVREVLGLPAAGIFNTNEKRFAFYDEDHIGIFWAKSESDRYGAFMAFLRSSSDTWATNGNIWYPVRCFRR